MFSSTAPAGATVFDDVPAVANLKPELRTALRRAATDAAVDGVEFFVNSGWRTPAHQERLLNDAIAKYGSRQEAARWVATPEKSAHVSGDAVDIGHAEAKAWLSRHGAAYGLCQIYRNEPWHYEFRSEAIEHGCPPLYADAAHDPRLQSTADDRPAVVVFDCPDRDVELLREAAARAGVRPIITSAPVSAATAELATGIRCISISHQAPVPRSVLLALRRAGVGYISTRSIGEDHIDIESARQLGITVQNVAYSPDSVADHTVMVMLMALRQAKQLINRVAAADFRLPDRPGRELRDLTVGVVGTGRIGTAVITRLAEFGCRILAHDRNLAGPMPEESLNRSSLTGLLRNSDIVTLHTPCTPETYHLIDADRLAQFKPNAVLINTGRGGLVDTPALVRVLESGALAGAALDVIEGEEEIFANDCADKVVANPQLVRLQQLPNVLITPHAAYYTEHALTDMFVGSITNCLAFGRALENGTA